MFSPCPQVVLGLARYDGDTRKDKATVVKMATTFLRAQEVLEAMCREGEEAVTLSQARLGGALLLVTEELEVLAVTEGITELLGLGVVEVLGSKLSDSIHPCDHTALRSMFTGGEASQVVPSSPPTTLQEVRQVVVRARCTVRGRSRAAGHTVRGRVATPAPGGEGVGPGVQAGRGPGGPPGR